MAPFQFSIRHLLTVVGLIGLSLGSCRTFTTSLITSASLNPPEPPTLVLTLFCLTATTTLFCAAIGVLFNCWKGWVVAGLYISFVLSIPVWWVLNAVGG